MINTINIEGKFYGWLYPKEYIDFQDVPKEMDDRFLIFNENNTIGTGTKTRMRDSLWTDSGCTLTYMGENGFFTSNTNGFAEDGKDGMVVGEFTTGKRYTLITTNHPSDYSGNYYRKWRGVITFTYEGWYTTIYLGTDWSRSTKTFSSSFCTGAIDLSPSAGDMLVLEWKISVS